jgi:multiple sugar transport system substrate-binding protein
MAQYKGKYYGMPWILDTKYMFANETLLKKGGVTADDVKTLPDLVKSLKAIKAKGGVKYPWMGSWQQAEAVVCDYAQFLGAYGGKFLDDSGKPLFNQDGGVQALQFMKSLLDEGLADPASTSALEADVLKAFAQGRIAMNLNWTFQLAAAKDPKQSKVSGDGVAIMHTPSATTGGPAPGCNGGQPVMITSGCKHVNEAWEFIKFITSAPVQDDFAKDSLPIWSASYSNPKVISAGGKQLVSVAKTQLVDMILRPQVTNYNSASQALQVQIQKALLGKAEPQAALNEAAKAFSAQVPG